MIAGGMGARAIDLFQENRISVITGAPEDDPEKVALDYVKGTLITNENVCDHGSGQGCGH